jgi:hypothetical protein
MPFGDAAVGDGERAAGVSVDADCRQCPAHRLGATVTCGSAVGERVVVAADVNAFEGRCRRGHKTAADAARPPSAPTATSKPRSTPRSARSTPLGDLSSEQCDELGTAQDDGAYLGPPGAAGNALQTALSRRRAEYEWGATGPGRIRLLRSHLVGLPAGGGSPSPGPAGSSTPQAAGSPWMPSCLATCSSTTMAPAIPPPSTPVGMYVGGNKMLGAPTAGKHVDVRSTRGDGHLMGARRIVG